MTLPEPQAPVRSDGGDHYEYRENHPAYGSIKLFQASGNSNLVGSDFTHPTCMVIEISRAERMRGLSNDRWFPTSDVVRVELSPAQFARFVGSVGQSGGTPCTLNFVVGEGIIPGIKRVSVQNDDFRREMADDLENAISAMTRAKEALQTANNAKSRAEASRLIDAALRALQDSAPFVARQFAEHIEDTVESAKAEAHAIMNAAIQNAGLSALQDQARDARLKLVDHHGE